MVDNKEIEKAKGVNKNIVDSIRHKEYIGMFFGRGLVIHNKKKIQSKFRKIRTYDVCKISLSCFDDKRYILDNGVTSLAFFHRNILNQQDIYRERGNEDKTKKKNTDGSRNQMLGIQTNFALPDA